MEKVSLAEEIPYEFQESKRSIPIENIRGVTKSNSEQVVGELVIHVKDDYDYRYRSE